MNLSNDFFSKLVALVSCLSRGKNMNAKEFKKLLKEKEPKRIIGMYCHLQISLTSRQVDRVLKLKNKKEGELWKKKSTII